MPGPLEIAAAYGVLLFTAALSYFYGQKLEKDFLWAGLRMGVQLIGLGLALEWVFAHSQPWIIIGACLLMTVNSALHSTTRVRRRYPGLILQNLITTFVAVWPLAGIGLWLLSPHDKLAPAIILPLLGMILGNALNGITLGLDHYTENLSEKRDWILARLAVGATPAEATRPLIQRALRQAVTPVMNAMYACGLITIPGMMTGQMLGGVSPMEAALYQIILMILISCGGFLGAWIGLRLCERRHFDARGALC